MNDREILWRGRYLQVAASGSWEFVERRRVSGIVALVPVTDDRRIVLIEQYRPAVGLPVIELPAGLVGDLPGEEDEALETAARRELVEETGYDAGRLELLFTGVPSAGITNEELTFFLASRLRQVGPGGGDASEDIRVHEVPLDGVEEWLREEAGREGAAKVDAKIYAGLYFARRGR